MTVRFIDKGLGLIREKISQLKRLILTIGFQGAKGMQLYDTGINVATVATYAEFGTQNAPARSFLRATMFEFRDKIAKLWADAYRRLITLKHVSADEMLEQVGRGIVKLVENKIARAYSWAKANAASTVKAKGFDYPLHETDLLSRSVTWAVRAPGGAILSIGGSRG